MTLSLIILWWIIGTASFIYWWTNEADLTYGEVILALIVGISCGPFAFIMGYAIHGSSRGNILIKKRK